MIKADAAFRRDPDFNKGLDIMLANSLPVDVRAVPKDYSVLFKFLNMLHHGLNRDIKLTGDILL